MAYHPCGGSFDAHFKLKNGRDAWLYGRVSYDYNVNQDHGKDGKPHWNFDIQAVTPSGEYLDAYKKVRWHGLPHSKQLHISIIGHEGRKDEYRLIWRKLGD